MTMEETVEKLMQRLGAEQYTVRAALQAAFLAGQRAGEQAERERCAKVADASAADCLGLREAGMDDTSVLGGITRNALRKMADVASNCAAAIRRGPSQDKEKV